MLKYFCLKLLGVTWQMEINVQNLKTDLIAIRDSGLSREKGSKKIFEDLLGKESKVPKVKSTLDKLLIRSVNECFNENLVHRDMLFVAFGLLQGYEYESEGVLRERRKKYLQESNYLKVKRRRKKENFDDMTENEQNGAIDALRKAEDKLIEGLAAFIAKQNIKKYIEGLDGYIGKIIVKTGTIIQRPSYIKDVSLDSQEKDNTKPGVSTMQHLLDELCEPGQGRLFEDVASDIWKELGLDGNFDLAKFEALLIKIIIEPHEDGRKKALKRDAGLLTFGLLHKYYHAGKKTAKERYWDYPNYGDYLDIDESSQREFSRLSAERQEEIIDELKQAGDGYKKKVYNKLLELIQNGGCNSFMDDAIASYTIKQPYEGSQLESKLQDPHYTLEKFPNMKYIEAIKYAIRLAMAFGILLIICIPYFLNQRSSTQPQDAPLSASIVSPPPNSQDDIEIARGEAMEEPTDE